MKPLFFLLLLSITINTTAQSTIESLLDQELEVTYIKGYARDKQLRILRADDIEDIRATSGGLFIHFNKLEGGGSRRAFEYSMGCKIMNRFGVFFNIVDGSIESQSASSTRMCPQDPDTRMLEGLVSAILSRCDGIIVKDDVVALVSQSGDLIRMKRPKKRRK